MNFVKDRLKASGLPLVRPTPSTPPRRLSTHKEEQEGDDSGSEASTASVGARGVAFSLGTPSAFSDVSDEEFGVDSDDQMADSEESDVPEDANGDSDSESESSVEEPEDDNHVSDADEELSSIMETLDEQGKQLERGDPDLMESYIGVMEDRNDLVTIPKPKRVLSFNTLAVLNTATHAESPKRFKYSPEFQFGEPRLLPSLSLGPAALSEILPMQSMLQPRRSSPIISSCDEDDLDRQLGEELDQQSEDEGSRQNTPVALLTPPHSPLTVELASTVCEWPSNLTVDAAMAAAINLEPLSSEALLEFKGEYVERVTTLRPSKKEEPSSLTPLLRGISMAKVQ